MKIFKLKSKHQIYCSLILINTFEVSSDILFLCVSGECFKEINIEINNY